MSITRQPAGSPEGGRFAPSTSPESDVQLAGQGPAAATTADAALRERIEQALAADDPDEGNWPTGDQVDAIVAVVREHDRARADDALEDLYAVRDREGDYLASLDAAIDTLES